MDDLSIAVETRFRLQDVEAFEEVDGESLTQEESLRKGLEGLSVRYDVAVKVSSVLAAIVNCNKFTTILKYINRLNPSCLVRGTDLSCSMAVF